MKTFLGSVVLVVIGFFATLTVQAQDWNINKCAGRDDCEKGVTKFAEYSTRYFDNTAHGLRVSLYVNRKVTIIVHKVVGGDFIQRTEIEILKGLSGKQKISWYKPNDQGEWEKQKSAPPENIMQKFRKQLQTLATTDRDFAGYLK